MNSAALVKEQLPLLRILTKTKSGALRREILNQSPDSVRAISSIAENLMRGTVPLSKAKYERIKQKFGKIIYLMARPRGSLVSKKKAVQRGGFLPVLGAILPAIAGLLTSVLK